MEIKLSPSNLTHASPQVEKSLQRIQSGHCNPMYTSQQSVENKVCVVVFKSQPSSPQSAPPHVSSLLLRSGEFPGGRPSCPRWVSGWKSPAALPASLPLCFSQRLTLEIICSSAAPPCSLCSVPELFHYSIQSLLFYQSHCLIKKPGSHLTHQQLILKLILQLKVCQPCF